MKETNRFVDEVCQGLKVSHSLRRHLREELQQHLDEAVETNKEAGMPEEEAIAKAIEDFGEPETVREGLRAVYGQRLIAILVERAMDWKERTLKSGWNWSFVAYATLAAVVFVQATLLLFFLGWILPVLAENLHQERIAMPDHICAIVRAVNVLLGGYGAIALLAVGAGLFVFERRYKGENKPMIRLAGGLVVSLVLMLLISVVSISFTVRLVDLAADLRAERPEQTVYSSFAQANAAFEELERAVEQELWTDAERAVQVVHQTFTNFRYKGSAVPVLVALDRQSQIEESRKVVEKIEELSRVLWGPRDSLQRRELLRNMPELKEAYARFKAIVDGELAIEQP
jgi:hypothetical protein